MVYYIQLFHHDSGQAFMAFRGAGVVISPGALRLRFPPDTADTGKVRHRRSGRLRAAKQIQMARQQGQKHILCRPQGPCGF